MRLVLAIGAGLFLVTGSTALAQQKNALDGYDEGFIEFFRMAQDGLKDKRTLEQMFKDNALIRAAGNGDVNAVRKALKAGALVNSYYIDGCAAFGSDGSGYTALMWATDVEVVKLLISEKADVNLKCTNPRDDGETALYRAVVRNKEAIVELLVKAGAKGDPKQIRLGLEMRRAACCGFKLKEGQGYPNYPGNAGGDGSLTIAEVLKKGADINAPDPAGYTPLMYAANLGLVENVKTLLARGADAKLITYSSVVSTGGTTALSLAEVESSYAPVERRQVVELLKAHLRAKETRQGAKTEPSGLQELRGSRKVTNTSPFGPSRLFFEGDKIIIFCTDTVKTERRIRLDPNAKPAQICVLDGESKAPGIYELSADTLRICLANWNADRPLEFKAAKGVVCLTLARAAEGSGDKKAEPGLAPEACKKALLEMMRSEPGQALGFFEKKLVDEMEKMPVETKKDEYHWTGAYRFDGKKASYVLFVSLGDGRPPLRPHPKGYLIHLKVFQGSLEVRDGRVVATVPKYKYTLLD